MARPASGAAFFRFLIPSLLFVVFCAGTLTYFVALDVATFRVRPFAARSGAGHGRNKHLHWCLWPASRHAHAGAGSADVRPCRFDGLSRFAPLTVALSPAGEELAAPPRELAAGERECFSTGFTVDQPVRIAEGAQQRWGLLRPGRRNAVQAAAPDLEKFLLPGLLPTLLIAFVAVALAWTGVNHGVAPLARIRSELLGARAERSSVR